MHRGRLPQSANQLAVERELAMDMTFSNRFCEIGKVIDSRTTGQLIVVFDELVILLVANHVPTNVDCATSRSRLSLPIDLQEKSLQNLSPYT